MVLISCPLAFLLHPNRHGLGFDDYPNLSGLAVWLLYLLRRWGADSAIFSVYQFTKNRLLYGLIIAAAALSCALATICGIKAAILEQSV